jgi:hypothetical protein
VVAWVDHCYQSGQPWLTYENEVAALLAAVEDPTLSTEWTGSGRVGSPPAGQGGPSCADPRGAEMDGQSGRGSTLIVGSPW